MNMFRAFIELDDINSNNSIKESYDHFGDRDELIDKIRQTGRRYNFEKYSNEQLYRMWRRIQAQLDVEDALATAEIPDNHSYCSDCGCMLTDGGFCPVCDDGVDNLDESLSDEARANLSIDGFDFVIVDTFEDMGAVGYNVVYSKNGIDLVEVEVWSPTDPVTVIDNLYASNLLQHVYEDFEAFANDLDYKASIYLK